MKFRNIKDAATIFSRDAYHISEVMYAFDVFDSQEYEIYLLEKTEQLLNDDSIWNFVSSIANLLMEKKKLSYKECWQLYNTTSFLKN